MWSKAWGANLPQTPSVYSQMHELGNAFRTFFDTAQDQSQQTAQQQILEQMVKQFTINPTIPNFPTPPTFADPNQLGNLANLGANWLNPQMPSAQPPALGIGREFQEDWSELLRLQQEYGTAVREFTEVYNKFVQAASAPDLPIHSGKLKKRRDSRISAGSGLSVVTMSFRKSQ